jgi:hypothetical protein
MMDGKWVERIALTSKVVQDPCFKKIEELLVKNRLQTREHLALPLFGKDGRMFAFLQFRLRDHHQLFHTDDARHQKLISESSSDLLSEDSDNNHSTFSHLDDQILKIIMSFVQVKLDKI